MNNKNYIIGGVIALAVIAVLAFAVKSTQTTDKSGASLANQEVSTEEPLDIALDFYVNWLNRVQDEASNPYIENVADDPLLSAGLRTRLIESENRGDGEIDPVLCQTTVPPKVGGRVVTENDDFARILVSSRDKSQTAQSTFLLKKHNDGWYISDIECAPGEFAPEREFTFDKEGFLLKDVPEPLNSDYWHLVFEENGEPGHFVPLAFGSESTCLDTKGKETTCPPDASRQTEKVHIYGQMTELGVEVTRLEYSE